MSCTTNHKLCIRDLSKPLTSINTNNMNGFEFNKVYVIESLNDREEKLTGTELYNDLLRWKEHQIKDFKAELIQVEDRKEFFKTIEFIKDECATKGQFPIIHFEIHGSEDKTGLILNSGELIEWLELYNDLREINSILGNNLFITLAVCHGAYIMELIKAHKPSPFWGFIGSFDAIDEDDLMIRYNEFYDEFLRSFNLDMAVRKLHESNSDIPSSYRFINSEMTFANVMRQYFDTKFTEKEIKKRFEDGLKQKKIKMNDRNEKHEYRVKFKVELLKTKRKYFEKHKRTFFMLDNFPKNQGRFKVEYEKLN